MNNKWYQKGLDWLLEKDSVGKKWYKRRIVWLAAIVVVILIMLLNPKGGNEKSKNISGESIPNVFGVTYTDATEILEADGFEVKAVETSVNSISDKLLYPLESVDKGSVFKIDDYILDGNGNLTLNYEILYNESMASDDKSIVIYYAKEAYSGEDKAKSDDTSADENKEETADEATSTEDKQKTKDTTTKETENKETNSGGIGADFKSAMDSYEKFFDEYVAIMKKYANNPSDMSILGDYTKYMGKYAQMMEDFEKWESEDMNAAETAYYLEVQGRITKKLLEVAQ